MYSDNVLLRGFPTVYEFGRDSGGQSRRNTGWQLIKLAKLTVRPSSLRRLQSPDRVTSGTPSRKAGIAEQLVAYLDGELSDEDAASIEQRLRKDRRLRQLADELDHTWGMLDALETVAADEQFSQRTMETIVATEMVSEQQAGFSVGQLLSGFLSRQALVWFGLGAVGAMLGLALAMLRGPSEETTQFLRDFELLKRYPQYSIIPHTDALQELRLPSGDSTSDGSTEVSP